MSAGEFLFFVTGCYVRQKRTVEELNFAFV